MGVRGRKEFLIGEDFDGTRLDRFVRTILPGTGFSAAQALIRKKKVLLNGRRSSGRTTLARGDRVVLDSGLLGGGDRGAGASGSVHEGPGGAPVDTGAAGPLIEVFGRIGPSIDILFEDEQILVIDKPSGLVVQPGNDRSLGSLLDLLEEYRLRSQARGGDGGSSAGSAAGDTLPPFRYTPVHRLDRGTSGALVVARTRKAARRLSAAFRSGEVEKVYLAVVEGRPGRSIGEIASPIETRKGRRSRSVTSKDGKPSVSRYRVISGLAGDRSLVEVTIDTGRTHQVRVHLASAGHPVVGDRQYGRGGPGSRLLLHSHRLCFDHPSDGSRVEITCAAPEGFGPEGGPAGRKGR